MTTDDARIDLREPSDVRAVRSALVSVLESHAVAPRMDAADRDSIVDQALGLIEEWFVGPTPRRGGSP